MNRALATLTEATRRAGLLLTPWEQNGPQYTAHPSTGAGVVALRVVLREDEDTDTVSRVRIMHCIAGRVFCAQAAVPLSKRPGDSLEDALVRSLSVAWILAERWNVTGETPDVAFGGAERGNPHGRMAGREGQAVWWLPHGAARTTQLVDGRVVDRTHRATPERKVVVAVRATGTPVFTVRYCGDEVARHTSAPDALRAALAIEGIDYEGAPVVRRERAA